MNTIEMLKESVDKPQGMYVQDGKGAFSGLFLCYDPSFGMCFVDETRAFLAYVELNRPFMETTWKPYVKPVDWSKVPIDTKVLCRVGEYWHNRHFAGITSAGIPKTWADGFTSWTDRGNEPYTDWKEVKLADATE